MSKTWQTEWPRERRPPEVFVIHGRNEPARKRLFAQRGPHAMGCHDVHGAPVAYNQEMLIQLFTETGSTAMA